MASNISCGPCSEEGKSSTAVRYCSDCEDHLCKDCTDYHSKFKQLKSHHLVELSKASILQPGLVKKYCSTHEDVPLDFFCTQHDTVCCRMCMPISHQSCKTVLPLDVAAKDINNSALKTETMAELVNIEETVEKLLQNRDSNLKCLEKTELSILKQVRNIKSEIITHVNELEQDIVTRLSTLTADNKTNIENQKLKLTKLSTAVTESKTDLNNLIEHGSENQVFLALHQQKEDLLNKIKQLQKSLQDMKHIDFVFKSVQDWKPVSLGAIKEITRPVDVQYTPMNLQRAQVTPQPLETLTKFITAGQVNLKDGIEYNITGLAITAENKLILCNHKNSEPLVLVYKDCMHFEREIRLRSRPYDVAVRYGQDTALVTLPLSNQIQLINVKAMKPEKTLSVGDKCYGIHTTEDRIIVGGRSHIQVLNTEGGMLQKIALPIDGYVYSVKFRTDRLDIICRSYGKVFCVNLDGSLVFRYDVSGGGQSGTAVDRQNNVYLCDWNTNNIQRLAADGTFRDIVLTQHDGVINPYAICFNKGFSRLFVVNGFESVHMLTCC